MHDHTLLCHCGVFLDGGEGDGLGLRLQVCGHCGWLPLGHAVTVLRIALGSALTARAVQATPSLPEEWETPRAWLWLRWKVEPQIWTGSIVWTENVKLLKK